jgi:hypothetical protein
VKAFTIGKKDWVAKAGASSVFVYKILGICNSYFLFKAQQRYNFMHAY